jgi:hypothetical protein
MTAGVGARSTIPGFMYVNAVFALRKIVCDYRNINKLDPFVAYSF